MSDIFLESEPDDGLPDRARKGRGAVSNRVGRFEPHGREAVDDGWGSAAAPDPDDELPPLRTTVAIDATRTIIARNSSPDIPFDQSINPYRGCEHGCIYCFARPTHAFLGLSPGLDFETKLLMKPDAAALLDRELRHSKYKPKIIAMGTNTDPYQPLERTQRITRAVLEVLLAFNHPVGIVTKSALIVRTSISWRRWRARLALLCPSPRWMAISRARWSRGPQRRQSAWRPSGNWRPPAFPPA
jgi:hypothetical protein